jgi:hypothetical protein
VGRAAAPGQKGPTLISTLILVAMAVVVTAALYAVGRQSVPAGERSRPHSLREVVRTAAKGNALLAAGPAWQYDRIAARH